MPIDLQATRARIRHAQDPAPQPMGFGYRDNDMARPRSVSRAAPAPAPAPAMDLPADLSAAQDTPTQPGPFLDLDAAPLALDAPAQPSPAPETAPSGTPDAAQPPAEVVAPAPPDAPLPASGGDMVLDPPRMRRIIFLATSLPGGTPPFAKAQPNLGDVGLRFGIGRFTQLSGDLGRLLLAMKDADPTAFEEAFAPGDDLPEASAQALLDVATAMTPAGADAASAPNMQPVAGKPLWSPEWIARFKATADHPAFQDAQYFTAAQTALLPMLDFARNMGLASEKGLTMLTERAIQLGIWAAQAFTVTACGPISSEALKREALVFLAEDPNNATLSAFQTARGLTDTGGRLDAPTHAALVAALRERDNPPIMIPSHTMMLDQLASAAAASPTPGHMAAIRTNPNLSDAPLAAADPVME